VILCLDPGTKAAGISIFEEDGRLHTAWLAEGEVWHETADSVLETMHELKINASSIRTVVIERMQVYQDMPIPPAVLITLSLMAGRVTGRFAQWAGKPVEYEPKTWKKQVPKHIKLKRIQNSLLESEKTRVKIPSKKSLAHNVWDAVGIGLFHLRSPRRALVENSRRS
jgi:Holliday junction resolvasome RuvABC endonuclease subunit